MFCGPCETREDEVPPEYWCTSCQEGLCAECQKHHKAIRSIRSHKTIPISQYNANKDVFSAYNSLCQKHKLVLDIYCPNHETACCSECVSRDHARCVELKSLQQFLKLFRDSISQSSLKDEIENCIENCDRVIQHQNDSKQKVHHQIEALKSDMAKARSDINEMLDKVEKDTLTKAENILKDYNLKIDGSVKNLETGVQCLNGIRKQFETLLADGTDFQVFQCSKETERKLSEEKERLQTMVNRDEFEDIKVQISTDKSYKEKLSNVFEVNVLQTPCNVSLVKGNAQSSCLAQIISSSIDKSFDEMKIEDTNTINLSLSEDDNINITSIVTLPNDGIILANYSGFSLIIQCIKTGEISTTSFSSEPFGIAVVDEHHIAVSFPLLKSVHFLRLSGMIKESAILFEKAPWGIQFYNGILLVVLRGFELQILDQAGTLKRIILSGLDVDTIYVFRFHDQFFTSNYETGAITSVNEKGDALWKLQNEHTKGTRNMCADQHGNLFVACMDINSVLVVSKDGKQYKHILKFPSPLSICFDETKSILYVCSLKGDEFKSYKISYT